MKADRADGFRVGNWTLEDLLLEARVEGRGPAHECEGGCCRHGVYVSLGERERILEYREPVRSVMDETQTTDTSLWFESEELEDEDFPGGRCVGTAVHEGKCVFLNREGLCTLQIAEADLADDLQLKPYYCRIFPLCTTRGRIEFDDICDGDYPCCSLSEDGGTHPIEAYANEFGVVLGAAAYRELRARLAKPGERV